MRGSAEKDFKASRVLKRQLQDFLMSKLERTFAMLNALKLFLFALFAAHWQACAAHE